MTMYGCFIQSNGGALSLWLMPLILALIFIACMPLLVTHGTATMPHSRTSNSRWHEVLGCAGNHGPPTAVPHAATTPLLWSFSPKLGRCHPTRMLPGKTREPHDIAAVLPPGAARRHAYTGLGGVQTLGGHAQVAV